MWFEIKHYKRKNSVVIIFKYHFIIYTKTKHENAMKVYLLITQCAMSEALRKILMLYHFILFCFIILILSLLCLFWFFFNLLWFGGIKLVFYGKAKANKNEFINEIKNEFINKWIQLHKEIHFTIIIKTCDIRNSIRFVSCRFIISTKRKYASVSNKAWKYINQGQKKPKF